MATVLVRSGLQYAWRGPSLLVVANDGAVDVERDALHGFYYREARFLSRLAFAVNGRQPWLCECAAVRPNLLVFTYVHPEITSPGGGGTGQSDDAEHLGADDLPERALEIRCGYQLHVTHLHVAVTVTNRARREVKAKLTCALDADFADLLEAQSGHREQEAAVDCDANKSRLSFAYQHPKLSYRTEVDSVEGWLVEDRELAVNVALAPQQSRDLVFDVVPHIEGERLTRDEADARELAIENWIQAFTRIEIPGNRIAERTLTSNTRDIASLPSLQGPADEWLSMHAGMPLYPAFFGRDAVTAGWQTALLDRGATLEAALTRLGRLQADVDDQWTDAEPGRIPYQMRSGPLARLGLNPYTAYYADYASPLMYVISLANLYAWTGDVGCVQRHWDTSRRIMEWARERGDFDGDGYLEYQTRSPKGTKNQGWKDSGDAIVYDDGSPVPSPIATCELQGYWYVAQELMAVMSAAVGEVDGAVAYRRSAAALKERFNRDWWSEDRQFFALALDPDKRQVRAATSNVGHCLATGIIAGDHLRPVVGRLFAPDMFSGWGIRTLSSDHVFYDPLSYHRGTVWAVEQGTIVFGLRRFGFNARAIELSQAMFDLADLYPEYRIPECVGGYARGDHETPGAYPRANTPQLWNATSFPLMIQSLLGLLPLAQIGTLVIDPILPEWLPSIVVSDLRVGEARLTLSFTRRGDGTTDWDVVHQQGTLRVVRQPPPESVTAVVTDRVWGLVESLTRQA
jgi:glycogen debranching enzyme